MLIVENEVCIYSESFELTDLARKLYYSNLKDTPFRALSDALKNNTAANMAALVFVNGTIYLAAKGGAEIKILRNNISATLIKSVDQNIITASGFPKDNDKMFLQLKNGENIEIDIQPQTNVRGLFNTTLKNFLKHLPKRNIYLKAESLEEVSPKSKKLTFSIAIILLILLGVSIGFGIRQKKINDLKDKYKGALKEASSEIDQAISLASVDSDRSRQLFTDSQQKIAQIDKLNVKDSELISLKQKINESRAAILGEYLVKPEMYLDLSLLSSGFKGDIVTFSGGQIYVMDTLGKRVVSVNASTKKSKVVAGPSVINSATSLACYEDRVFVLESDGIYEVGSGNQKVVSKTWSGDALIAAFAGNLYVLDKSGNSIYRYAGLNNAFGEKQNWLSPGTNVNFANVNQITIDGSIYALFPNSKILKFSQGSPLNFNVKGAIPEIGNIDAVNASPDNQSVYLLDRAGGRVVVVDKKGVYKAQYVDSGISQAVGIIVSEADKKIILLTGDKLYSLDIKHL